MNARFLSELTLTVFPELSAEAGDKERFLLVATASSACLDRFAELAFPFPFAFASPLLPPRSALKEAAPPILLFPRGLNADALDEEEEAAETGDFFFPEVAGGVTGRDGFFSLDVLRPDCRTFIDGEER